MILPDMQGLGSWINFIMALMIINIIPTPIAAINFIVTFIETDGISSAVRASPHSPKANSSEMETSCLSCLPANVPHLQFHLLQAVTRDAPQCYAASCNLVTLLSIHNALLPSRRVKRSSEAISQHVLCFTGVDREGRELLKYLGSTTNGDGEKMDGGTNTNAFTSFL